MQCFLSFPSLSVGMCTYAFLRLCFKGVSQLQHYVCVCERAGELFPINYLQDFLRPLYLLLLSWKHDIIRIADNIFYLLIKLSQSGFLWHELKHVCSEMQYNKCYWKKKKAHSDDVSITRIVKAYMHARIQGCYTTSLNINTWSKLQQPTQLQCWAAPARA